MLGARGCTHTRAAFPGGKRDATDASDWDTALVRNAPPRRAPGPGHAVADPARTPVFPWDSARRMRRLGWTRQR